MQSKILHCDFDIDFDKLFAICQSAIVFQVSVVTVRSQVKTNTNKNRRNHRKSGRKRFYLKNSDAKKQATRFTNTLL